MLFDLDGVLLDSRENMRLSWECACKQLGIDVGFDKYFSQIGRPFPAIMTRLGLADQAAELEAAFRIASMNNIGMLNFYTGVVEALAQLDSAGIKLGIVTSKDTLRAKTILAMLPVKFACVETPTAALRGKPAPDHLLMAMAQTNVDPVKTVYIGDMDVDHEAAVRARIDYAHAAWGYGGAPDDGSAVFSAIGDLLASLRGGDLTDWRTQ